MITNTIAKNGNNGAAAPASAPDERQARGVAGAPRILGGAADGNAGAPAPGTACTLPIVESSGSGGAVFDIVGAGSSAGAAISGSGGAILDIVGAGSGAGVAISGGVGTVSGAGASVEVSGDVGAVSGAGAATRAFVASLASSSGGGGAAGSAATGLALA